MEADLPGGTGRAGKQEETYVTSTLNYMSARSARQAFSGRAVDDLAVIIQIRWLIENSGYDDTAAMLAWFDHHTDLPMIYAEAGIDLGLAERAKAKQEPAS